MRRVARWPWMAAVLVLLPTAPAADPARSSAAPLVQAALDAERQGDSDRRRQLLDEALQADPDYPPARWQSGQLYHQGQWRTLAEVEQAAQQDSRLAQYQHARKAYGGSPVGQLALARWCRQRDLAAEAKVHWLHVLEAWPRNAEALRALEAEWNDGELVSRETAELRRKRAQAARRSTAKWRTQLDAWRQAIEQGAPADRRQAIDELEGLRDPEAVPMLLGSLHQGNFDVALAKVEALSHIEGAEATEALMSVVVASNSPGLQAAAARKLDRRPRDYVVGRLLEALSFPLESSSGVTFNPAGGFHYWHTFWQDGAGGPQEITYHTTFEQRFVRVPTNGRIQPTGPNPGSVLNVAAQVAARSLSRAEQQVQRWNSLVKQRNAALTDALERVTGESWGPDPRAWWNWWYGQSPEYRPAGLVRRDEVYSAWHYTHIVPVPVSRPGSCFAAGTKVQTQQGPRSIETLEPGDQVLAQDTATGELRLAPVLRTTLRTDGAMVRVRIGSESILATEVHPFWVVGQGWKIARSLESGDRLHTLRGTSQVDVVEPAGEHDAYNLIVEPFHTYFVGESQMLVHDVTLHAPTEADVPGLAAADAGSP